MAESDCRNDAPWNFRWAVNDELALMGWPRTSENIKFIISQGIKHLITLSPEMLPPDVNADAGQTPQFCTPELKWSLIAVEEFEPPRIEQIVEFIEICKDSRAKNERIGVHCRMGQGRSGVMAACYLVYFRQMTPERAITTLRLQRPGCVETYKQEKAVSLYYDLYKGRALDDVLHLEQKLLC